MKKRNNGNAKIERDTDTDKTIVVNNETGNVTVFEPHEKKAAWSLFRFWSKDSK